MNKQLTLIFLFVSGALLAQEPAGYYDNAQGLTGYQLKTALSNIITNGHTPHSYDDLYNAYETTDVDHYYENDGTVLDIYSENPTGPDPYNYHFNQNEECGNYSSEGDCYNREHLMPQSWFGSASPMKSDAHHVVPTDGKVNGMRGHYPLADVASASWTSMNGSKRGSCADQGYSGTVFEPIDEFKGDIARIYFYMATRYEDEIGSWQNANDGSMAVFDGTNDHVFNDWYLQVLLNWAAQDPVSQREIDRNNAVYAYQGNRNPFIDHPEWINAIWNPNPDTTPPSVPTGVASTSVFDTAFTISWQASTDDFGVASYEIYLDAQLYDTTTATNYTFNGLTPSTTYTVCIKAKDTSGNLSDCSPNLTVTTAQAATYIINENFDNCPTMAFVAVNEASDKNWECITQYGENDSPAIQINGYQEDVPSKDWLITQNAINFDNYNNEKLSMFLAYKYCTTPLELVYSNDYDGNGQPWLFTWTTVPNVNIPIPDNNTSTTTELTINEADISSINGTAYLAFKYYSNGSPTRWTVDSVKLSGDSTNAINEYVSTNTKIYPNPLSSTGILRIAANGLAIQSVLLYDMIGKTIPVSFNQKTSSVKLNQLKSGIYFVRLQTNKGIAVKKLIIE